MALRIFVRDARKEPSARRLAAVPPGISVAKLSAKLSAEEARLCIDGFTLGSWEMACQLLRDGDVVDLKAADSNPFSMQDVRPAVKEPRGSAAKARLGFLTPKLRQALFKAEPASKAAAEVPEEAEEPEEPWEQSREEVGLRLLGEHRPWQPVLQDEARRSFAFHRAQALTVADAERLLQNAQEEVQWQQPKGTWGLIPRKTSWMTTAPCCCRYGYGGLRMEPEPMPPWVLEAMELCMPLCGLSKEEWPNSCNLNLYEDGEHSVGWHSDDEALFQGKFQDCRIISLSLGAPRIFELKTRGETHRLQLRSGDLCTMEGMLQKHYQHRVPKDRSTAPRVNLTWRWIVWHERRCPLAPRGRVGPSAAKTFARPSASVPCRKRPAESQAQGPPGAKKRKTLRSTEILLGTGLNVIGFMKVVFNLGWRVLEYDLLGGSWT
ncbi:unnamed protein product [Effrenium voratum]|nr:unnamed protein product [Effrenium voratum]